MDKAVRSRLAQALLALALAVVGGALTLRTTIAAPLSNHSQAAWEELAQEKKEELAASPNDLHSLFWLAVSYANTGKIREASNTFKRIHQLDPSLGVVKRLRAANESRLSADPHDLSALNAIAFLAYAEQRYQAASDTFQVIVALDPDSPWVRAYWGYSLGKADRVDDATRVLEQSVALYPDNRHLHLLLGMAYYRKGWLGKAFKELALSGTVLSEF